jgi:TRAP-type C4-dicarboxylate transport system permease small subunit
MSNPAPTPTPTRAHRPLPSFLFANTLEILAATMLVAICLAVFINVIFRYFLHIGLGWTEEAARYLQIWMMFVGATIAVKRWTHFQMTIVDRWFNPGMRRCARIFAILVVMTLAVALVHYGIALTKATWEQTSPMMGWSIGRIYVVVPSCGALMVFFSVRHLIDAVRDRSPRVPAALGAHPDQTIESIERI